LFVFIGVVMLSCVTYAQDAQDVDGVEDPYGGGMMMKMMMPKGKMPKGKMNKPKMSKPKMNMKGKMGGGGGGGGSMMGGGGSMPKKGKTTKPKMGGAGKMAMHSSTGRSEHVNGTAPQPATVTSSVCQYTVKAGDTLSGIGGRIGVSWQSLAQQNHLVNPSLIHPGQVLSYACGGSAPAPPTPPPSAPPASGGGSCRPFADSQWNCATPACTSHVSDGAMQPSYECAEFVARSLASAGRIPGLSPMASQGAYANFAYGGHSYDLCWTSSRGNGRLGLEDYLKAAGWHNSGASTSAIGDCSVVFAYPGFDHVGVGVGQGQLDAHNKAHVHYAVGNWRSIVSGVYNQ